MAGELIAGLGALKTAFDIAKTLKDMDSAATRNTAIIELQEKLFAARDAQDALLKRIGDLEKQVANFEAWDTEKERYQLTR
jgi:CII-binding regulator of phage lambda lysogenization HflD